MISAFILCVILTIVLYCWRLYHETYSNDLPGDIILTVALILAVIGDFVMLCKLVVL